MNGWYRGRIAFAVVFEHREVNPQRRPFVFVGQAQARPVSTQRAQRIGKPLFVICAEEASCRRPARRYVHDSVDDVGGQELGHRTVNSSRPFARSLTSIYAVPFAP